MNKNLCVGLVTGAALTLGMSAQSAVVFDFNYTDVNTGFNAAGQTGQDRRDALERAADYLAGFFTSYNADIFMDVDGSVADGSTLAAAGPEFNAAPVLGFGNQGDVMLKILGGNAADPDPTVADGGISWNFTDFSWELGNDLQAGEYDFFSTAVHELLHVVGLFSDIAQNGNDPFDNVPGTPGNWAPFDEFVADSVGALIDDGAFTLNGRRWDTASTSGGAGGCGVGLLFIGPNAVAANGGNAVELYSPSIWEEGSSGSHLDDQCYDGTFMMEAAAYPGLGARQISALEQGILKDIGYTRLGPAPQVPAPPVLYMLPLGLVILGWRHNKAR